jgi:hypothetical protein
MSSGHFGFGSIASFSVGGRMSALPQLTAKPQTRQKGPLRAKTGCGRRVRWPTVTGIRPSYSPVKLTERMMTIEVTERGLRV